MDSLIQTAQQLAQQCYTPIQSISKRIVYIINDTQNNVSNSYTLLTQEIINFLSRQGFDILCFVHTEKSGALTATSTSRITSIPKIMLEGVSYIHSHLDISTVNKLARLEAEIDRYTELFELYRPEVVLCASFCAEGLPVWVAAQRLGLSFYSDVRGLKKEIAAQDNFLMRQALKVFTSNQSTTEKLACSGIDASKIELIPSLRSHSDVGYATASQWHTNQGKLKEPLQVLERLHENGELSGKAQLTLLKKLQGFARLQQGCYVPARRLSRAIPTQPKQILYCLHQSLPYTTNGYATRSHGVAVGLQQAGFKVRATTRLGFPWDFGVSDLDESYSKAELDGITYMAVDGVKLLETALDDYIEQTAGHFESEARTVGAEIIVAASNHITALPALIAARRLGLPFVYEVRGLWEVTQASVQPEWAGSERYQLMRELEQQTALEADFVITLTEELAEELVSWGVPRERIGLVPNAVDAERFQPIAPDAGIVQELQLTPGVPVIGYAGSVVAYEGVELLLEALAILKKKGQGFIFVLVGDGKVIETVKVKAKELGIEGECRFTGRVPFEQVPRYLSCMDILPIPRLSLPVTEMVSALKPLEGMAMGKALVLSDVSPHITMAGVNGERARLFKKDSAQALSEALQALIDNPGERQRLGQAARHWIESQRTWRQVSQCYAELINGLMKS